MNARVRLQALAELQERQRPLIDMDWEDDMARYREEYLARRREEVMVPQGAGDGAYNQAGDQAGGQAGGQAGDQLPPLVDMFYRRMGLDVRPNVAPEPLARGPFPLGPNQQAPMPPNQQVPMPPNHEAPMLFPRNYLANPHQHPNANNGEGALSPRPR